MRESEKTGKRERVFEKKGEREGKMNERESVRKKVRERWKDNERKGKMNEREKKGMREAKMN
jgi:hypothetical protein